MSGKRKVINARQDDNGKITHVLLDGNRNMTPIGKAIDMAEQGQLANAHAVTRQDGSQYLRTNPDSTTGNNLDQMAKG